MENTPPVLIDVAVAPEPSENADQPMVDSVPLIEDFNPPVASAPERVDRKISTSEEKWCKRLLKEKDMLQKQVVYLRKKLVEMRKLKDRCRKMESKLMARPSQDPSEKYKQRGSKKLSAERKQAVVKFLSRDENSFLLAGKKDTIPKNKQIIQRRVLTKPLNELTVPKSRDRDKCLCVAHENMRLLALRRRFAWIVCVRNAALTRLNYLK